MKKVKRGVTNVIATLLIFGIMIASMGVLYGIIAPTIFGFDAEVKTRNQEFVMISIGNAVKELATSAEGAQSRVSIESNGATYSVNDGHSLTVSAEDLGGLIDPGSTITENIGSFTGNISGLFQDFIGIDYMGKIGSEDTFISTNNTQTELAVYKGDFSARDVSFSMYMRASLEISNQLPDGSYDVTIAVIIFEFQAGFVDFPVDFDQWTLRLRRRATSITRIAPVVINGDFIITHSVDSSPKTTYTFPALNGQTVQMRFIIIPILLTI